MPPKANDKAVKPTTKHKQRKDVQKREEDQERGWGNHLFNNSNKVIVIYLTL